MSIVIKLTQDFVAKLEKKIMSQHSKLWSQLTEEEKIETFHVQLSNIIKSINHMARAIMVLVDIQEEKGKNHVTRNRNSN